MKKLVFVSSLIAYCIPTVQADAATHMIQTIQTYRLLEDIESKPLAAPKNKAEAERFLKKALGKASLIIQKNTAGHLTARFSNPAIALQRIEQALTGIYYLTDLFKETNIELKLRNADGTTSEAVALIVLETAVLQATSQKKRFELLQKLYYFLSMQDMFKGISPLFGMMSGNFIKQSALTSNFFKTIVTAYLHGTGGPAQIGQYFNFSQEEAKFMLTLFLNPQTRLLTFNYHGWNYTANDILAAVTEPEAQTLDQLIICMKQAVRSVNIQRFKAAFAAYLNNFCWVYRHYGIFYVADKKGNDKSKPAQADAIKAIIEDDSFPWKGEEVSVDVYKHNPRTEKLGVKRTQTLQDWISTQYF